MQKYYTLFLIHQLKKVDADESIKEMFGKEAADPRKVKAAALIDLINQFTQRISDSRDGR
jgi:hypothetical protein